MACCTGHPGLPSRNHGPSHCGSTATTAPTQTLAAPAVVTSPFSTRTSSPSTAFYSEDPRSRWSTTESARTSTASSSPRRPWMASHYPAWRPAPATRSTWPSAWQSRSSSGSTCCCAPWASTYKSHAWSTRTTAPASRSPRMLPP